MDFLMGFLFIVLVLFGFAFCYSLFWFVIYAVWWFLMLPFRVMVYLFHFIFRI